MQILPGARFSNGDLRLDNLIVRDRRLFGVIDFENAGFNDPINISISWSRVERQTYPGVGPVGRMYQPCLCQRLYCIHCHGNRVGYEDGLNFLGGATLFDPNGVLLAKELYHQEELVLTEIDQNLVHRTRAQLTLPMAE